ncbi:hypothetical protein [Algoriphagus pacificus]|uniref:Uncharacterized protein n=1 Tax=Algoriphagus pacificus TaxID=2811234 RepID=A0ABS3CEZ8_9BACT|nr:hypothetical protein [Algoriphagus pacificus]MBN7814209.1 hypothetical protein [Algoriphagus pacificus]
MNNFSYPTLQERSRPFAISCEADFVRGSIEISHSNFIGNSIFIKELYKDQLSKRFENLKSIWESETFFSSSIDEIVNNNAYRGIIELGPEVLPLIFEDLKANESHWFYALESITNENPIETEHRGIFSEMKNDWLNWATLNHYINVDESPSISQ